MGSRLESGFGVGLSASSALRFDAYLESGSGVRHGSGWGARSSAGLWAGANTGDTSMWSGVLGSTVKAAHRIQSDSSHVLPPFTVSIILLMLLYKYCLFLHFISLLTLNKCFLKYY